MDNEDENQRIGALFTEVGHIKQLAEHASDLLDQLIEALDPGPISIVTESPGAFVADPFFNTGPVESKDIVCHWPPYGYCKVHIEASLD